MVALLPRHRKERPERHSITSPADIAPPVEVERPVDRRPGRPGEAAVAAEERRRRAVPVLDRGPGELSVAAGVCLRPTVVEERPLVLPVRTVHRRLAGAHRAQRHEHDEDDDADQRHQDQVADRPAVHVTFPINFTPCAAHRARPFSTSFATRRMSIELSEALRRHLRADRAHAVADAQPHLVADGGAAPCRYIYWRFRLLVAWPASGDLRIRAKHLLSCANPNHTSGPLGRTRDAPTRERPRAGRGMTGIGMSP